MINRIRDVRRAKGLTLNDVAKLCDPPTTAQTIGRLETGTRTLSLDWLNRIAAALGVDSAELVQGGKAEEIAVAARLTDKGAQALAKPEHAYIPQPSDHMVALKVQSGIGDYRAGDTVWLRQLNPDDYTQALNRDVLVPRPAGRFLFGRLIGREGDKLHILPLGVGARQQVVNDPAWIGMAETMIRSL